MENAVSNTKFGDCIAKVRELAFSGESERNFRGTVDEFARVQSAAIISDGYIDIDFVSKQAIIIEVLSNAPWNVIEKAIQEDIYKRKGAGTSLIEAKIHTAISQTLRIFKRKAQATPTKIFGLKIIKS